MKPSLHVTRRKYSPLSDWLSPVQIFGVGIGCVPKNQKINERGVIEHPLFKKAEYLSLPGFVAATKDFGRCGDIFAGKKLF